MRGVSTADPPDVDLGLAAATRRRRPVGHQRLLLGFAALAVLCLAGAVVGSWTVTSGPNDSNGGGANHPGKVLPYWSFHAALMTTIPGGVPSAASTAPAGPTILPAGSASYVLNTATGGHSAIEWTLIEDSAAPASTEIEVTFTDTTGAAPSSASVTIYVETQSTVSATVSYNFYYDAGAAAIVFDNGQELSQPCSAVGTCP